jgi:hypothetical protein
MNAQFDHNSRVHIFQVSLAARPDGRIGPPQEVIMDDPEPHHRTTRSRRCELLQVVYDHVDAEHGRLIYRVVEDTLMPDVAAAPKTCGQ